MKSNASATWYSCAAASACVGLVVVDLPQLEQRRALRDAERVGQERVGGDRPQRGDAVVDGGAEGRVQRLAVDRRAGPDVVDGVHDRPAVGRAHAPDRRAPRSTPSASATQGGAGSSATARVARAGRLAEGRDHVGHAGVALQVVAQQRPARDVGAGAVDAPHEALVLERAQRIAQRRARDAELPGQLRLRRQPLAGRAACRRAIALRSSLDRLADRASWLDDDLQHLARADARRTRAGASSSGMTSLTTPRMPPSSRASMSSACTWSR